jgi:drug/metabolite transporter (DMT)-like permease
VIRPAARAGSPGERPSDDLSPEPPAGPRGGPSRLIRVAPWIFILIWSSGYVVAKAAAPHADPLTFLVARYAGVIAFMGLLAALARAPWPSSPRQALHIAIAGVGIQAGYLGCVWQAIEIGMPAGVVALIVNLQPVLTAVAGPVVGERVFARQWLGLALGFAGVALVVSSKLASGAGVSAGGVALAVIALVTMTAGTLYQKRFCPTFDLRTGQIIQFAASIAVTLPFAIAFEEMRIEWTPSVVAAMFWSVFVLTGGGISLLFLMIRHGAATQVTSYLYLVPPVTALLAWLLFGELFRPVAAAGMAITIGGVALVVSRRAAQS